MTCIQGISENLINDCTNTPMSGVEETFYICNRAELTLTESPTNPALLVDAAVLVGKKAFSGKGYRKSTNVKSTLVTSDILPETWTHDFDLVLWGLDAATMKQIKELNDVVIFCENKNKGLAGNGAFNVLGVKGGLWKTTAASDQNTDGGMLKMTLSATEQSEVKYVFFKTDYATTKQTLEDLLIVQD